MTNPFYYCLEVLISILNLKLDEEKPFKKPDAYKNINSSSVKN